MYRKLLVAMILAWCAVSAEIINVVDNDIQAGQSKTWTAGNTYILMEKVFVEEGATLTIEPGVVVKAVPTTGAAAAALIICRGGKIYAEGTRQNPIVFTALADDLLPRGQSAFDVVNATGQWGGVVILGKARTNMEGGTGHIEGINVTDARGTFGGTDDNDNSGVFRYASIRFAGMEVSPDVELNGLTMGAVGDGTIIEYVEVYNNSDDGFEWFGGSVNTRYLVTVNMGDDGFDYDVGFRGRGQFWCALMGRPGPDSRMGEHDGAIAPASAKPYAIPVIANATYLAVSTMPRPGTVTFRDNAGGKYLNSIFMNAGDFEIQEIGGDEDSESRFRAGQLAVLDCMFWSQERPTSWSRFTPFGGVSEEVLTDGNCALQDPQFNCSNAGSRLATPTGSLDLRPKDAAVLTSLADVSVDTSGFIQEVSYKGAFAPWDTMWIRGWTALDYHGFLSANDAPAMEPPVGIRGPAVFQSSVRAGLDGIHGHSNGQAVVFTAAEPIDPGAQVELYSASGRMIVSSTLCELSANGKQTLRLASDTYGIILCHLRSESESRYLLLGTTVLR